jgi:hypothetical protein
MAARTIRGFAIMTPFVVLWRRVVIGMWSSTPSMRMGDFNATKVVT